MIKNYFKTAWLNITRHKVYSGINIIGLSIGIAAFMLILQYVGFELSYEDFHTKKDRIYRVQQNRYNNGTLSTQWAAGAYAAGNSFNERIPEIEDYVKLVQIGQVTADNNNQPLKIDKVFYASSSFFTIFSYPLLSGDSQTALQEPFTAVISESTSKKLYGNETAIGKTLNINKKRDYKITGVFKDMPKNTQLQSNVLFSYATYLKLVGNNNPETAWQWDGCLTYLLLRAGTDPKIVEAKFPPIVDLLAGEEHKKFNSSATYLLQPIRDIHLYSHLMAEPQPNGDGKTVYLLLGIAFFIVVIAWVNYINLATARAINRAKEVGIRKVIGSSRRQLVFQFLFESALLNSIALVLALIQVFIAIPAFNQLSGQHLTLFLFGKPAFWLGLAALFFAGVFFAGLYPAFVLSGFKPITVLKGKMVTTTKGALLRKSLVVVQFAASFFLLVGTLTVYRQIRFMQQQSLGLNIEQTLVVEPPIVKNDSTFLQQMKSFKEELLKQSSIKQVAVSSTVPGGTVDFNAGGIRVVGQNESEGKQYRVIDMDYDFINLYGLKLIAGRNFSRDVGTDSKAVIFNRMGIQQLGFNKPEEAIGKQIEFWGDQFTIAGVTENFHQQSLRETYEPLILRLSPDFRGFFSMKVNTAGVNQTIGLVKAEWNRFFPGNTFEYFFLDDHFNDQYKADQRFGKVFGLFTILAIFVACLGLFGLASFTTVQRTKEIGIRKVLGASVPGILKLLYREFALLLVIAFVIAIPVAWYSSDNWLQNYAFRSTIHWTSFFIPFALIVLIALLTVSYQSIKAAIANPVKSLRTE